MSTSAKDALQFVENFKVDELYLKLPQTDAEWRSEIWLKHPLERMSDYKKFAENFLPLPVKYRSIRLAFHIHIKNNPRVEGMTWADIRTKQPTSNWYLMAKGQAPYSDSSRGVRIKQQVIPYTWKQRALAYNKVKGRVVLDDFLKIRDRVVTGELEYSIDALDLFDKMFYKWKEQLYTSDLLKLIDNLPPSEAVSRLTEAVKEDKLPKDLTIKDFKALGEITKIRDAISVYARRSLGLPSVIKEDQLATEQGAVEVEFVNDYGLAQGKNQHTLKDDITNEELQEALSHLKTVEN